MGGAVDSGEKPTLRQNALARPTFSFHREQSEQEHFIDSPSEADLAVNFDDRNTFVELLLERGIAINIDDLRLQSVLGEEGLGVVAQVATLAGIKHDVVHRRYSLQRLLGRSDQSEQRRPATEPRRSE